ncbi:hypothetical protein QQP08_020037 [Theobroma cacao]|nr:hypothetical protein QQP08_020037 [Theobroma cacao]
MYKFQTVENKLSLITTLDLKAHELNADTYLTAHLEPILCHIYININKDGEAKSEKHFPCFSPMLSRQILPLSQSAK